MLAASVSAPAETMRSQAGTSGSSTPYTRASRRRAGNRARVRAASVAPLASGMSWSNALLLALAGPITALPMMLFTFGARRISFAAIGVLQFLAPSLQFATGIAFGEPFTPLRGASFALIWAGLGFFAWDTLTRARKA